jgi:hypothetical protein
VMIEIAIEEWDKSGKSVIAAMPDCTQVIAARWFPASRGEPHAGNLAHHCEGIPDHQTGRPSSSAM